MNRPSARGFIILTVALFAGAATAHGLEKFSALTKVQDASLLTNQELSEVEGSALIFGSVNTPLYSVSR